MEEMNDVQAFEKISSEVDQSQRQVIFINQRIKAQAYLNNKLNQLAERHREIGCYITSSNLKVKAEIKQAEQEIRCMLIAQETLKTDKVEIRKQWLVAKHQKADILDRVTEGTKKYEAMWSACKTRYESIPFVLKLLQAEERQKICDQHINNLEKEIPKLFEDMEIRRKKCAELNKTRTVELANYMINERPRAIQFIKQKSDMINNLIQEKELLLKEQGKDIVVAVELPKTLDVNETKKREERLNPNLFKWEDDNLIPKLNLGNFDLDNINVDLDQVKIKNDDLFKTIPIKTHSIVEKFESTRRETVYDYMISPYFKTYKEDKSRNYSEKKLINILEDLSINPGDLHNIVKNVNTKHLKPVSEISAEVAPNIMESANPTKEVETENEPIVSEKVEEIDLTTQSSVENIIIPPTQFRDVTLLDETPRKRVSFDLQSSMQINEIVDDDKPDNEEVHESVNQNLNSQLNASIASDDSFKAIKEMLLKKHNLDLSPQFVYAKNNAMQKKDDDVVTSKFFESRNEDTKEEHNKNKMEVNEDQRNEEAEPILELEKETQPIKEPDENVVMPMDVDIEAVTSPQPKVNVKTFEEQKSVKTVRGLLFTHGTQEIPESLNVSLSTNGYEDSDFPHLIDSSLLSSPKACVPAHNTDNNEGVTQEVPNFLSGFRKTGFSFFGGPSTSFEPKPESNNPNEDNFSFNFGGEKKNRGGLFSLFR